MPAPEIVDAVRIVATPPALEEASWPTGAIVLRVAPDEVILIGASAPPLTDPHALVAEDHGLVGVRLDRPRLRDWMEAESLWPLPETERFFCQGNVAGLAVKIWVDAERALVVTDSSLAHELERRL